MASQLLIVLESPIWQCRLSDEGWGEIVEFGMILEIDGPLLY